MQAIQKHFNDIVKKRQAFSLTRLFQKKIKDLKIREKNNNILGNSYHTMPNDIKDNNETVTNLSKFTNVFSIYFDKDKIDGPNSNPTRIRENTQENIRSTSNPVQTISFFL